MALTGYWSGNRLIDIIKDGVKCLSRDSKTKGQAAKVWFETWVYDTRFFRKSKQ